MGDILSQIRGGLLQEDFSMPDAMACPAWATDKAVGILMSFCVLGDNAVNVPGQALFLSKSNGNLSCTVGHSRGMEDSLPHFSCYRRYVVRACICRKIDPGLLAGHVRPPDRLTRQKRRRCPEAVSTSTFVMGCLSPGLFVFISI